MSKRAWTVALTLTRGTLREDAFAFAFFVALGSIVALAGCGSSSPAPSPSAVTVPGPVPVQLSGVATDDDGAPVSGVSVFVYPFFIHGQGLGNAVTSVSDASGRYSITFNSNLTPGGTYPFRFRPRKAVTNHTNRPGLLGVF